MGDRDAHPEQRAELRAETAVILGMTQWLHERQDPEHLFTANEVSEIAPGYTLRTIQRVLETLDRKRVVKLAHRGGGRGRRSGYKFIAFPLRNPPDPPDTEMDLDDDPVGSGITEKGPAPPPGNRPQNDQQIHTNSGVQSPESYSTRNP